MLLDLFPQANAYEDILELKALYSLVSGNEVFSANLPIDRTDEIIHNFSVRMAEKVGRYIIALSLHGQHQNFSIWNSKSSRKRSK